MSVTQSRDSTGSFLGVGQMISPCRVLLNSRSGTAYIMYVPVLAALMIANKRMTAIRVPVGFKDFEAGSW
jgi:hypothetical protein